MIQLRIEGTAPDNYKAYLSERTIRVLIDGSGQRYSRGWRSDDDFFHEFVSPTFPIREDWDSWTEGHWRGNWIQFWASVRDFYNDQAQKIGRDLLWRPDVQTNLTTLAAIK